MNKYVQYGCGLSAPKEWINYDASPTLVLQKIPLVSSFLQLNTKFPSNVKYGDIVKGLPIDENSCDGLYCSHTLEHLSLYDFRIALKNSFKILKKGGIFRCVVPDLEYAAKLYLEELKAGKTSASIKFISITTMLGVEKRSRGLKGLIVSFLGNSKHLWMWDYKSLEVELKNVGFNSIRKCEFSDCNDKMFKYVEEASRFKNSVAFECIK
ncbi:MAG: methyltransferase domain-containing protein [Chitinophagaceae bacterium]|nr:methyltransferase domain-containing protein [Chitinophagaceae bacterium]